MEFSVKGLAKDLIIKHEGLILKPYLCPAGRTTIGYGRNLDDNGIDIEEAEFMLDNDVSYSYADLCNLIPNFEQLPPQCAAALLDMIYNLGHSRFIRFRSMLGSIKKEDFEFAADEMLDSVWATQVPERAQKLAQIVRECSKTKIKEDN